MQSILAHLRSKNLQKLWGADGFLSDAACILFEQRPPKDTLRNKSQPISCSTDAHRKHGATSEARRTDNWATRPANSQVRRPKTSLHVTSPRGLAFHTAWAIVHFGIDACYRKARHKVTKPKNDQDATFAVGVPRLGLCRTGSEQLPVPHEPKTVSFGP